jgi:menaquinol-cytochrome c reductase iron-sulfur subunit
MNEPIPSHPAPDEKTQCRDPWSATPEEIAAAQPGVTSRRSFLFKVAVGLNALVGAVLAVPIVGFLVGPAMKKDEEINQWVELGALDDFPVGKTRLAEYVNPVVGPTDGMTSKIACWVRRTDDGGFQVFAINCAHLGCPVRWFEQSRLFLCPCHGGAYYEDGARASGPPTRGLFQYRHRALNGRLAIFAGQLPTFSTEACNQGAGSATDAQMVRTIAPNADGRPAWKG